GELLTQIREPFSAIQNMRCVSLNIPPASFRDGRAFRVDEPLPLDHVESRFGLLSRNSGLQTRDDADPTCGSARQPVPPREEVLLHHQRRPELGTLADRLAREIWR